MTDNRGPQPSPFRRPSWMLSAAAVGIAATAGIALFVAHPRSSESTVGVQVANPAPSANGSASACHPTDTDLVVPSSTPGGLTWQMFGPFPLPYSSTAGPLVMEDGLAWCYARTPLGAALAAVQISTRMQAGDDAGRVSAAQAMPGTGLTLWNKKLFSQGAIDTSRPDGTVQIGAFRVVSFSPQMAVIELCPSEGRAGHVRAYAITLGWDTDWKLIVQPNGELSPPPHRLPSADGIVPEGEGFIRWRST